MPAAAQFTELQPPPEFRGETVGYCRELADWSLRYHLTLEPMVQALKQQMAEIAALTQLTQTISSPPTQAQVEAVQAKVNAIIAAAAEVEDT